jgi:hypothetical protein
MTTPAETGTITVRTRIFPLAFILLLFKTTVTIDGVANELPWGEHSFPVAAGAHELEITFKYLFGDMGRAHARLEIGAGSVVRIDYRSSFIVFMPGKLEIH